MRRSNLMEKGVKQGGLMAAFLFVLLICAVVAPASAEGPYDIFWKAQLGTATEDTAYGMAGDGSGNVYVVGKTTGNLDGNTHNGGTYDAFIVKYDSGGALLCSALLGTTGNDMAYGVAVDPSTGDVLVVGETSGALGTQVGGIDLFLAKYDSTCVFQSVVQDGTVSTDIAWGVTVNSTSDIYVTGETAGNFSGANAGGKDLFIAKYNSSLVNQYVVQRGTSADDIAYAITIVVDPDDPSFEQVPNIVGETSGDLDGAGSQTYVSGKDMFWSKYKESNTTFTVMAELGASGTGVNDVANGIATDNSGNIYISGYSAGNLGGTNAGSGTKDIVVAKYDLAGTQQWIDQFGTANDDTAESLVTDIASGEVFVAGVTAGNLEGYTLSGTADVFITKYNTSGTRLWTEQIGTTGSDSSWSIVYDAGLLYVAGETTGDFSGTNAGGLDILLAQLQPDTATPQTTIGTTKPANPTKLTSATFSFSCDDWDPLDVAYTKTCVNNTFECRMDASGAYAACSSGDTFTGLSAGSHTFYVRAKDASGNTDASPATYTWTVDLTAPNTTITVKPTDPSNDTTPSFTFTSSEASSTFMCAIDPADYLDLLDPAYVACNSGTITYPTQSAGAHTFAVYAIDPATNADSTPATYTWNIDLVNPDTTIDTGCPSTATVNTTSITFTFSADEAATFECKMTPASTFTSCTSAKTYTGLGAGSKTFTVRAKDTAGNYDATPATCIWTVDLTAPNTTIATKPSTNSNDATPTFTFTSSEASSTFMCAIDPADYTNLSDPAYAACNSGTITYTTQSEGAHTFAVYAIDPATNADSTPATYTWTIDTEVPDTTILTNPAAVVKATSGTFTFNSTEAVSTTTVTYECKKDAETTYAVCTSPKTYTGLTNGNHTFYVRAKDAAGNTDSTPDTYTWRVDTSGPVTTIDVKPSNPSKLATATFEFSFTADYVGETATFKCKKDTAAYADCTSPVDYTGLAIGSHTFYVYAIDTVGNAGAVKTWTWTIDQTAPDTSITAKPTRYSSVLNPVFSFTSTETGSTFQCAMDPTAVPVPVGEWGSCTSGAAWPTALALGDHTFKVRALDKAGNPDGSAASYTWTITNDAPTTTITNKPAVNSNASTASFSFTSRTGAAFQCRHDVGATTGTWGACTSPKSYTGLAQGAHTFNIKATDAVGTEDPPVSYTWNVDTSVPNTTILTKPAAQTKLTTASFTFTKNEAVSTTAVTFQCKRDAEAYAACTSPKSYTGLTEGSHTFYVRAKDAAGNIDTTPATYTWKVDLTAPDTSIVTKPPLKSNDPTPTFVFGSPDASATFQCKRDAATTWTPCSKTFTTVSLSDGSHTMRVRAVDAAGNIDPMPSTYTWTIDTVAPETTITGGPANGSTTTATTATFTFSSPDATATFQCKHDVGATAGTWGTCTSPKSYTGLTKVVHTFSVRAKDPSGNIDAVPATRSWTVQ